MYVRFFRFYSRFSVLIRIKIIAHKSSLCLLEVNLFMLKSLFNHRIASRLVCLGLPGMPSEQVSKCRQAVLRSHAWCTVDLDASQISCLYRDRLYQIQLWIKTWFTVYSLNSNFENHEQKVKECKIDVHIVQYTQCIEPVHLKKEH